MLYVGGPFTSDFEVAGTPASPPTRKINARMKGFRRIQTGLASRQAEGKLNDSFSLIPIELNHDYGLGLTRETTSEGAHGSKAVSGVEDFPDY